MSDTRTEQRKQFEQWYVTNAFYYERDPIGSHECGLQWKAWQAAQLAAAAPGADDNGCKSCAILRRYEKTARERGYAMGKAAGNNELAQAQELLAFERNAHAETNAALTAEITRLEAQLAAAAPGAAMNEFEKCPHPECGRFKDGAGWGCRAMRDNACVRND